MKYDPGLTEKGFTLVELLVSIAILGLILVALIGGLHFAGRAWSMQERRADSQGDINAVETVLRQLIASGNGFEGNPVAMKFVGRLPAALERGGLYDLELRSGGERLVLSWRPHFKGPSEDLERDQAVLLNGVGSATLSYYVAGLGWTTVANDKLRPQLVQLSLQLTDGRKWPSLVMAPAIDGLTTKAK